MRKSLPIAILSIVLTAIVCLTFTGRPQAAGDAKAAKRVQKWEYKYINEDFRRMSEAGEEGWEAYAVTYAGASTNNYFVWFKRPKAE